jgi:hypothetical protein
MAGAEAWARATLPEPKSDRPGKQQAPEITVIVPACNQQDDLPDIRTQTLMVSLAIKQAATREAVRPQHLLLLLLGQLLYLLTYGVQEHGDTPLYLQLAAHFRSYLLSDHVLRTPGYPFFLYMLGQSPWPVLIAQHLLVVLMAWLAWRIMLPCSATAAAMVFWIIGLHPFLSVWASFLLTEIPTAALLLASVWAVRKRRMGLAGAFVGLATLFRPVALVALPALLFGAWDGPKRGRSIFAVLLTCSLVVTPWVTRNLITAHYLGISALVGGNMFVRYSSIMDPPLQHPLVIAQQIVDQHGQVEGDRICLQRAVSAARRKPLEIGRISVQSAKGFMGYDLGYLVPALYDSWSKRAYENGRLLIALKILFQLGLPLLLLGLALRGARTAWHDPALRAALLQFLFLWGYVALFAHGNSRFRAPVEGHLMLIAVWGATRIIERRRTHCWEERASFARTGVR